MGPNAAGKSNLLDAVRFMTDIVTVGGGFEAAVKKRGGVSALRSFAARRYPSVNVGFTLGTAERPDEWEYSVNFIQDNQSRPVIKQEIVRKQGKTILQRPDSNDKEDPERLHQTHLEQVNDNRAFRGIADFFSAVKYLHIVPQLVREPERSVGRRNDPFGGDFLEQVARVQKRTRDARLKKIVKALTVAVPQLEELELETDIKGVPHLRGKYRHWRRHGAWQSEEQFSDGTLRLMGLLWALMDGRGPLLLEEPELSLHPEVVRHIPQMMGQVQRHSGRQILVSTHSYDLLLDQDIDLSEVVILATHTEGTKVTVAREISKVVTNNIVGIPLPETLATLTAPTGAEQLSLFSGQ